MELQWKSEFWTSGQVAADFGITNDGHMRQEIEIGLLTLNGKKFI